MIFVRRRLLICNLLLITLLTSLFSVAATHYFTSGSTANSTASILNTKPPTLDCHHYKDSAAKHKCLQAWYDVLKNADSNAKTAHQCHSLIKLIPLFPATALAELKDVQAFYLALFKDEQLGKPHSFTELIYRPPIG